MTSPKSSMITRFKKKFLVKHRKYDIVNGIEDPASDYHNRNDIAKLEALSSSSPKKASNGMIIWQNNTYDILPCQLESITSKSSNNQHSLPRKSFEEEIPPLPIKTKTFEDPLKRQSSCDNCGLIPGSKTPSPTDTYVTPIARNSNCYFASEATPKEAIFNQPKSQGIGILENSDDCIQQNEVNTSSLHDDTNKTVNNCLLNKNGNDSDSGDKCDDDDKEHPDTWLTIDRSRSPLPSVGAPSPTESEKASCTDTSITSDVERKPALKKREKSIDSVKPPMMRPLRKKRSSTVSNGDANRSSIISKEDSPLPPSPTQDSKQDSLLNSKSQCVAEVHRNCEMNKIVGIIKDDGGGYTSMDELQEHLKHSSLGRSMNTNPIEVDNQNKLDTSLLLDEIEDTPFPPPPPPFIEAIDSLVCKKAKKNKQNFFIEEGLTVHQTVVKTRYKDGLLHCSETCDKPYSPPVKKHDILSNCDLNQNRNTSHESGYETSAGIDHSSSNEQIRDDVFHDAVKDLLCENIDYGKDEMETNLNKKHIRRLYAKEMYALPKSGLARSHSNISDTSTDNYPDSPENTETSESVSSPEDIEQDSEKLCDVAINMALKNSEVDKKVANKMKEDYLPPIPTRNYRTLCDESNTTKPKIKSSEQESNDMISSIHSEVTIDSEKNNISEPVHMTLAEVREQAKTLGVPLAVSNVSVNQSQPCLPASKTQTISESSNDPISPTGSLSNKRNTFPKDKCLTPTNTPTKKGSAKKKAKIRIATIFSRNSSNKNSPEHLSLSRKSESSSTESIQRRSLPLPPPGEDTDDDKTPQASPARQRPISTYHGHGPTHTTSPVKTLEGYRHRNSSHSRSNSERVMVNPMTRSVHVSGPGYASRTLGSQNNGRDTESLASFSSLTQSSHASLASSVTSINSGVSSSGYASNYSSNADFIGSLQKLKHVGWYWGPLGWDDAESKLGDKPDGSFLVRDSSDDRYILSLSFRSQSTTHHTRIEHYKGMFSFYSQPKSHGAATIIEFIEKAMEHSRSGKFLYFLRPRAPGLPPAPVQLLYPISRFKTMQSLQHVCRFEIIKHVRKDHIDQLPVPQKVKDYLLQSQYYIEFIEEP